MKKITLILAFTFITLFTYGQSSYPFINRYTPAIGDLLYYNGTQWVAIPDIAAATGKALLPGGITTAPSYGNVLGSLTGLIKSTSGVPSAAVAGTDFASAAITIGGTLPISGGGNLSSSRTLAISGLTTYGTANQIPGTNAGATAWEYKTVAGSASTGQTVSFATNQINLSNDTSVVRMAANSYSLSGMQTKLNLYGKLAVTNAWASPQIFNMGLQSTGIVDMQSTNFTGSVSSNARFTDLSTGQSLDLFPVTVTASRAVRIQDASGTLAFISDVTSPIVGTPTISAGAGAGTAPTVSVTSNGKSLQVTVTTGTLPTGTNAVIATVTLANVLSYTPYPVFSSPPGAATLLNGASMIGMSSSGPSNVTITSGTTALVAATTYVWNIAL